MGPSSFSFSSPAAGSPFASQPAQASSSSSGRAQTSKSNDTSSNGHSEVSDSSSGHVLHLNPAAYKRNGKAKWEASGRTVEVAVSPVGGEIASWISKRLSGDPNQPDKLGSTSTSVSDQMVYLTSGHLISDPLLEFYAETYTLFTSLQRIVAASFKLPSPSRNGGWDEKLRLAELDRLVGPPEAETIGHMSRVVALYLEEVTKIRDRVDVDTETRARFDAVYHVLNLAEILFLPRDGRGEGLLGEELLDWVNQVDPAPENTLGNEIMRSNPAWEHPAFWPYISRCILRGFHLPASTFLRTLENHSHAPIAKLAALLATHLSQLPRSHNTAAYPLDHQFLTAHQQWLTQLRAEFAAFRSGKQKGWLQSGGEAYEKIEDEFRIIIELMEGKADQVLEQSNDWREAVGAWGILVNVGLRRDDLPGMTSRILKQIPVNPKLIDDVVQSSLCTGDIITSLTGCHDLDLWLAAHLADVFDKLSLIPDEERFDMSLRDYLLLDYSDLLADHPKHYTTWSLVADYLHSAGDEGQKRLKEFILHVGIGRDLKSDQSLQPVSNGHARTDENMDVEEPKIDAKIRHFAAIREVCMTYGMEEEWRMISSVMADRLVRSGDFGIAATMFSQAEDDYGLARLSEKVVDVYLQQGEDEFLTVVNSLPPILLNDAKAPFGDDEDINIDEEYPPAYTARFAFLARFRDFILFRQQGANDYVAERLVGLLGSDLVPASFRSVLLYESIQLLEDTEILIPSEATFELMRVLEDVKANSAYAPVGYLGRLQTLLDRVEGRSGKSTGNGTQISVASAEKKLDEVRLALARNLARAMVANVHDLF